MAEQTPNTTAGTELTVIAAFSLIITGRTERIKITKDKKQI